MYAHVYERVDTHVYTHVYTHIDIAVYAHVDAQVYTHVPVNGRSAPTDLCTYMCVRMCMHRSLEDQQAVIDAKNLQV